MSKRYNNYHKHSDYSNIKTPDSITKVEHYLQRTLELGHDKYFTTEHGYQGNLLEILTKVDAFNSNLPPEKHIQMVVGTEAYFVQNIEDEERSSSHLILIAINNKGVEEINEALTIANREGFYYRPRLDFNIIKKTINPKNVIATSACVSGLINIFREDWEEFSDKNVKWFKDYFGKHFFLEIQSHDNPEQKKHNEVVKSFAQKYNIQMIHANDSHYILPEDSQYRDIYLRGKDKYYPDNGFILDYPDYETIIKRYEKQGIFTRLEVERALNNTMIFDKCEPITLYNKEIKIPQIIDNPEKELKKILNNAWVKNRDNIPKERWKEYLDGIREETKIITDTKMESYFVINNYISKKAEKDYNAVISKTARGSAGSFYINSLLGLTNLDRFTSPIKLYPTRFMSTTRILQSKSLPDVDFNLASREPFIKATEDILGKEYCGWMIAFGKLQASAAFKTMCKGKGLEFEEYNEFGKYIAECSMKKDKSYKEDSKWGELVKESERFVGVIDSISPSPCSMLLSTEPVEKHVGYIKVGNMICCNMDKNSCDNYKYLKNDYLKVEVWETISEVYKLLDKEIPSTTELETLLNEKTFEIYEKGLTCMINQVESPSTTEFVMKYKPKSVSELSAFIAAIRPGFASLLDNFLNRKPYTTGVKELDEILDDSFHYLLYQESIMKYLIWLGIDESETYSIIKKISKKNFKGDELTKLNKKLHDGWIKNLNKEEGFAATWKVVEDASDYSFNASHSLSYAYDSLYTAYLKANYPIEFYTVALNICEDDQKKTSRLINELSHFGIKLKSPKFRYSRNKYFYDKEQKIIYKGTKSIKFMNEKASNYLYDLKDKEITFIDLLQGSKGLLNKRQIEILIKIGYFEEFGGEKYLLDIYNMYTKYKDIKQIKKDNIEIPLDLIIKHSQKETAKLYKEIDSKALLLDLVKIIPNNHLSLADKIQAEYEYSGSFTPTEELGKNVYVISDIIERKKYIMLVSTNISNTTRFNFRAETFTVKDIKEGDVLAINRARKTQKNKFVDGKWVKSTTEYDIWIESFEKLNGKCDI